MMPHTVIIAVSLTGVREVTVPMPAGTKHEPMGASDAAHHGTVDNNHATASNSRVTTLPADTSSSSTDAPTVVNRDANARTDDPPWVSAAIRNFASRRGNAPPAAAAPYPSAACGGESFMDSLLAPLGDWFAVRGEQGLCLRQASPRPRASFDLLARADGGYPATPRRGAQDADCGCAGGRKCAGCATSWDGDLERCPICGSGLGGRGRGFGCEFDGEGGRGGTRGIPRGYAPTVLAPRRRNGDVCF